MKHSFFQRSRSFLTEEIWRLRGSDLPKLKAFGLRTLRVVLFAYKGFREDKCQLSAAALTFWTLFSIVPVFAMAFGIAKGFGLKEKLQRELTESLQGQEEVIGRIVEFSDRMLETTSGGLIAGIGVVILFFAVLRLLGNIELALNGIWGVKENRIWVRKFSDYLTIMMVCPILFLFASSLNVFLATQVRMLTEEVAVLGFFSALVPVIFKLSPFVVMWVVFSFIYIVIPNTRVSIGAGIVGGIVGGTIYQLFQALYIFLQVGVASYSAIYGSFAALPLFLFWLQTSWLIMLFGSEIAFAFQNVDTYEFEPDSEKASCRFRRLSALLTTHSVVKAFENGAAPVSESDLRLALDLPVRLLKEVLYDLVKAGVLVEVRRQSGREVSYLPGRDVDQLTPGFVLRALDNTGVSDLPLRAGEQRAHVENLLSEFESQLDQGAMGTSMKAF